MNHPSNNPAAGTAVIVGRWQIFHKGHETLLKAALRVAPQVIVVMGSAYRSRNPQNPFNWEERRAMILATLSDADKMRVQFLPVRDYYNDERWNRAVRTGVQHLTQNTAHASISLVGFKKDNSSYYLDHFPDWAWTPVEQEIAIDATHLRNLYFSAQDSQAKWETLRPYLSPKVWDYLQTWAHTPEYAQRVTEHLAVVAYRKRWTAPFHLTADALVQVGEHVLLIKRGGDIGHGLWALPGGFVEPDEQFYNAALRELQEETGWNVAASTMQAACKGSHVFDHPRRSPRGRIITQAYFFDLGDVPTPSVQGADDAMDAQWIAIQDLPQLESQLFDDHAAVLDHFLGIYT